MGTVSTPIVNVHEYEGKRGDYCQRCGTPEGNRRHRVADAPIAEHPYDLPADTDLVDQAIRHCLNTKGRFSANDMRPWLDRMRNGKAVAGPRLAKWKKAGLIREDGHEKSTQSKTKGKVVAVYVAGPNWKKD